MNIFNRKELFITRDLGELSRVRDVLDANGILHAVRSESDIGGTGRSRRRGSAGINLNHVYQHYIYVHRDDFEHALHLIRR